MRSIKWMMQDKRNLQGIKDEYRANPNSPTLVFLVQDYVNNAQSTLESLRSGEASLASGVTYDGFEAEVRQMRQAAAGLRDFIPFAQQVVKEKKTQVPALWMSAAGHLEALLGNNDNGIKLLDQAMKLKGTERMIDNARVCRMMATVPGAQPTQQYLDYLKGELEWLTYAEGNEYDNQAWQYGLNGENHYSEMIVNLCYDYLGPKFIEQGNANLGLALMSWCDSHERDFFADREAAAYTMSRDCYWAIDNLTADQMISFQRYMASQPNSALEQYLRSQMGPNMFGDNYFNDKIGTKLLREGRFDEAIPWLEKVDTRYLSSLKISAYMAWRDRRWSPSTRSPQRSRPTRSLTLPATWSKQSHGLAPPQATTGHKPSMTWQPCISRPAAKATAGTSPDMPTVSMTSRWTIPTRKTSWARLCACSTRLQPRPRHSTCASSASMPAHSSPGESHSSPTPTTATTTRSRTTTPTPTNIAPCRHWPTSIAPTQASAAPTSAAATPCASSSTRKGKRSLCIMHYALCIDFLAWR